MAFFAEKVGDQLVRDWWGEEVNEQSDGQHHAQNKEAKTLGRGPNVMRARGVVHGDGMVNLGPDFIAVFLQLVESILDEQRQTWVGIYVWTSAHEKANLNGLIYRFFDVPADIVDLIDATHGLVGVRDVDGGHVKSGPIEAGPFAQLLHNLHHYSLPATKKPMQKIGFAALHSSSPVRFVAGLISLGQVEPYSLGMLLAEGLDNVERPLAQGLYKINVQKAIFLREM